MNKLWGGRFKKGLDQEVLAYTSSINIDKELARYDILSSTAHIKMLAKCNIILKKEAHIIVKGLKEIEKEVQKGSLEFDLKAEDIHSDIQNKLQERIGPLATKLQTARSRNDQISLDMRLYCKEKINQSIDKLKETQKAILEFADKNMDVIIPGFTHLQHAQPILLSHQMLSFLEMFERDKGRLTDAYKRVDVLPAGSCALAGTSLNIDRQYLARELGFSQISNNSIDAVSDRDFIIELLSALSVIAMHLSRLAEDIILLASSEFNYLQLDEAISTGSSIMPQKKNPDVLELLRGQTGSVYGGLISVLVMMKGLPLSYNRDMQLDKQPLFSAFSGISSALEMVRKVFIHIRINKEGIKKTLADEFLFATDLAEYLVKKGIPFKEAHNAVGAVVKYCMEKKARISELSLKELKGFCPKFEKDVYRCLDAQESVKSKTSLGGTSPLRVNAQIKKWQKIL